MKTHSNKARTIPLAQLEPATDSAARRRNYTPWRVGTLVAVYVLATIHIIHWKLAGRTLAPLELNELMYTLELGIITAGFILMSLAVLSVFIFGRFFCSWGCHILALQDLCAWILRKLHIRPRPVRSRVLLLVGPGAFVYMFIWPQVQRLIEGRPVPILHLRGDEQGWASFVTDDFWRNLPDPWIALTTFFICGFLIVYVLGSRSFCLYGCPYGAIFGIADRVAPGRIKVDASKCEQCGVCTGVCESHVRVHDEIARFGSVVDPACLKDLDCVAACPNGALSFGLARPSLLRSFRSGRRRLQSDFSLFEDVLMAGVFLLSLAIFRGLYGVVPFLMTLAIGGILAYGAVLGVRLVTRKNLRFNSFQLKRDGMLTRTGLMGAAFGLLVTLFVAHSGVIRAHELLGERAINLASTANTAGDRDGLRRAGRDAVRHLSFGERWGLLKPPGADKQLALAHWSAGDDAQAERYWQRAVESDIADLESRLDLAASYLKRDEPTLAEPVLRAMTSLRPRSAKDKARYAEMRATAWQYLSSIAASRGDYGGAYAALKAAVDEQPSNAVLLTNLAIADTQRGDWDSAVALFRRAVEASPENPSAWSNLGNALMSTGKNEEAAACLEKAQALTIQHTPRGDAHHP